MCGRYVLSTFDDVVAWLGTSLAVPEWFVPRYNIAPTTTAPVLLRRAADGPLEVAPQRFGLVPSWAKELSFGARCNNARSETAHEKPAFRDSFRRRRCAIPATGYYEWRAEEGGKQPYFLTAASGEPLLFAGLWASWRAPSGELLESFAILTRAAAGAAAEVHDRMPVCLDAASSGPFVDPQRSDVAELRALLAGLPPADLTYRPVSRAVNRAGNEGPQLLEPIPGAQRTPPRESGPQR
jgi:putative SOS response-associated peptidase YedK